MFRINDAFFKIYIFILYGVKINKLNRIKQTKNIINCTIKIRGTTKCTNLKYRKNMKKFVRNPLLTFKKT
jgi:hypothetical protein